jgi:serine protease Do
MEETSAGMGEPTGQPIETPPATSQEVKSARPLAGRTGLLWIAAAIILALTIGTIAIFQAALRGRQRTSVPQLPQPTAAASTGSAPSPAELSNSFRAVAKTVRPAVVSINVYDAGRRSSSIWDFFGFEPPPQSGPRQPSGSGSGFIVTPDGYVLTNNHVIRNADQIEVILADNRKMRARIIGTDPESDLAVIKIDGSDLPTALLGNSDELEQGDWVLAIGSPFGFAQTLTAGIVSATGREVLGAPQYSKFIQTDASINPGNSGGPLVNMRGEVIGINTLIASNTGQNAGVGFAIASNVARSVFEELARKGKVERGYLGVTVGPLEGPQARALCMEANSGALVQRVDPDAPAGKAGFRWGDVITSFDGKRVKSHRELTDAVAATTPGKSVRIDFMRDCEQKSVTVEVAERPLNASAQQVAPEEGGGPEAQASTLGIAAQTVTPEMAAQGRLIIPSGALVRGVRPGSPAALGGVRHGDVIHRVDKSEITTAEDLVRAEKSLKSGDEVALKIERGRELTWLTITIP